MNLIATLGDERVAGQSCPMDAFNGSENMHWGHIVTAAKI